MATFKILLKDEDTEYVQTADSYATIAVDGEGNLLGARELVFKNATGDVLLRVKAGDVRYVKEE